MHYHVMHALIYFVSNAPHISYPESLIMKREESLGLGSILSRKDFKERYWQTGCRVSCDLTPTACERVHRFFSVRHDRGECLDAVQLFKKQ